ncbi:hypothetical protein QIU18_10715 [Capnocytophaga canimorsus]|nr:hypothetical protein [Capnocytophaga canimorsus]WGU70001.1 hypothetical protein QIU18_10715 [Capnocytophaga canimorsus]
MKNILLLFVIIFQLLSCESNKREPMKYDKYRKYVWQSEVVVPSGYPAAVYGSFYTKKRYTRCGDVRSDRLGRRIG